MRSESHSQQAGGDRGCLEEQAPAKINISLRVLGRRPDGYHELESAVAFMRETADTVRLRPGEAEQVAVGGPFAHAIVGPDILQRTLLALRRHGPALTLGGVELVKRLPVASGIGGGSADAAALLRLVRRLNGEHARALDWSAIAQGIGADVPACLAGQPLLLRGTGNWIDPLPAFAPIPAVLVTTDAAVPADKTAQVFRRLAAPPTAPATADSPPPRLDTLDAVVAYARAAGNDLTRPAVELVPSLAHVLAALGASDGCRLAQMSGAGPTCFGLFGDPATAARAAQRIAAAHPGWWVRSGLLS